MNLEFTGKKVLVTGGNSAIGICLSRVLIEEGLFPVLAVRNEQGQRAAQEELNSLDGLFSTVFFDLDDPEGPDRVFKVRESDPDYLVDLAQTDYESLIASSSPDKSDAYLQTNIAGRARLVRAASRSMLRKRFGRMIFVSSAAAGCPGEGQGFYAASKQAGEALYANCALELGARGVTAMSIRPGFVNAGRGERFLEKTGRNAKRPADVDIEDLCRATAFFLSDGAAAFNGISVTMDHGVSFGKNRC